MPGVTPAKSLYLVVLIRLLDLEPANSRGTSTNNSTLFPSRQVEKGGVTIMADHGVAKMPALHPSPGTILVHAKADGAPIICGVAASRRCLGRVCSGCGPVPFSHVASTHWLCAATRVLVYE